MAEMPKLTPSEFIAVTNETLEYSFSGVLIEGEVASFKVNQGKWVFFDLKDEESSISCFMTLWGLKMPIEDGMKVVVRGVPKLTKWGKFSVTVSDVRPVGEGSLKKSFEILKKKLTEEGLFDSAKKRALPKDLTRLGVISSTAAAGYHDFVKILNARWGGIKVSVAHTQVQGFDAPAQIIRALRYFNERGDVQVIAILRGGGSADDLAAFNDKELVRAVAASKIPVITGVGHEVDETLIDFAADVRASTPSNAAEILTLDRKAEIQKVRQAMVRAGQIVTQKIDQKILVEIKGKIKDVEQRSRLRIGTFESELKQKMKTIEMLNPEKVLKQGYAILAGKISPGSVVKITTETKEIKAEVKEVYERK
ncbi:MAG: exodeoxyribonuclease VII large subunit [Candidatus Saccharibacteria bacterium]|nr:exodeoxyribonuclease VII large subunit [Candidatus Saccharibacteria bacterium]